MKYAIERDDKEKAINVKMTGLLGPAIRKEVLSVIANEVKITNYFKVMIDVTEATFDPQEPVLNALALIDHIRSLGIEIRVKFAFIYKDAEMQRKFFANMAQSKGINIKYFTEFNAAKKWLST